MNGQYSLAAFFVAMSTVALVLSPSLALVPFIVLLEAIVFFWVTRTLIANIPTALTEQSYENCRRLDGSYSPQRAHWEERAYNRMRIDLIAMMTLAFFALNFLILLLHVIFPLNMLSRVVSSVSSDTGVFKQNLRESGVERDFERYARRSGSGSNAEIASRKQNLWNLSPLIAAMGVAAFVAVAGFIRYAYLHTLVSFHAGLQKRADIYAIRDITRIQSAVDEEVDAPAS